MSDRSDQSACLIGGLLCGGDRWRSSFFFSNYFFFGVNLKTTSWSDVGPKSMTSIRLSIDCLMTKKGRVLFFFSRGNGHLISLDSFLPLARFNSMQRDRSELVSMSLQNGWTRKFFLFLSLSLSGNRPDGERLEYGEEEEEKKKPRKEK